VWLTLLILFRLEKMIGKLFKENKKRKKVHQRTLILKNIQIQISQGFFTKLWNKNLTKQSFS
jgi:hypothetical protein